MARQRPRIRTDGVYVCKTHYVRYGYSENSEYRPTFDVFTYKYLRFHADGTLVACYSTQAPKKFVPKFFLDESVLIKVKEDMNFTVNHGRYCMWDDRICLIFDSENSFKYDHHRYDGVVNRQSKFTRFSYDAERHRIVAKQPRKSEQDVELLSNIVTEKELDPPDQDYIAIDFFGQKVSLNYYREHHSLEVFRDIEPFYNGVPVPPRVNG